MERTLVLLKPDCVHRPPDGPRDRPLRRKGLNFIALKMMRVTQDLARRHYAEHVAKGWYPNLERFITGGPIAGRRRRRARGDPCRPRNARRHPRPEGQPGNHPRRLRLQPANEPRPRLRRPRRGPPRDRTSSSGPGDPQLRADHPPLAAGGRRELEKAVTISRREQDHGHSLPAGVSARSCSIMSRVAASTASCHRAGAKSLGIRRAAYGRR